MPESKAEILGKAIRGALLEYDSIAEIDIYGLWSIDDIEEFKVLMGKLGRALASTSEEVSSDG